MQSLIRRPAVVTGAAVVLFLQAGTAGLSGLVAVLAVAVTAVLASGAGTWNLATSAVDAVLILYVIVTTLVSLLFGVGLWKTRRWAQKGALLFEGVQVLLLVLVWELQMSSPFLPGSASAFALAMLLPIVVMVLLLMAPPERPVTSG